MELAFINTNHPDFIGGDGAINQILDKMVAAKQEQATTQSTAMPNTNPFVRLLLFSYYFTCSFII